MNYLGHALLAAEFDGAPRFVLGAMLPDLLAMLRVQLPQLRDEELARGVAFHVRTDAVFHDAEIFIELNRWALGELREQGVGKGPARAIAHMGTEMLIDAALAEDPRRLAPYLDALRAGREPELLHEHAPLAAELGWSELLLHLEEGGAKLHTPSSARLSFRFGRALAGRRLLEPNAEELRIAAATLAALFPRVQALLPDLWAALRRAI